MTAEEEWRDIPGWEGLYQASSLGRIRSLDRIVECGGPHGPMTRTYLGCVRKAFPNPVNGRLALMLKRPGQKKQKYVSALVCEAFHGQRPMGADAAHNDGDLTNNCPTNLRWASRSSNLLDRQRHGTSASTQRKLTDAQIKEVRRLRGKGWTYARLATHFGLSRGPIAKVCAKKTYMDT